MAQTGAPAAAPNQVNATQEITRDPTNRISSQLYNHTINNQQVRENDPVTPVMSNDHSSFMVSVEDGAEEPLDNIM